MLWNLLIISHVISDRMLKILLCRDRFFRSTWPKNLAGSWQQTIAGLVWKSSSIIGAGILPDAAEHGCLCENGGHTHASE
jgi:hypothetical protein